MRLPLLQLEVFTAIARAGSLRGAAEDLGLTPATVSQQLKTLEERLGTALFFRTTRSVSLTEAGKALLKGTGPAFDQITEAVAEARDLSGVTRGRLRLTLPEFVYHAAVAPMLDRFRAAYPEIELDLDLSDRLADLPEHGVHGGFRLGSRIEPDMIAVKLGGPLGLAVLGAPGYFSRHGRPAKPSDLMAHACIGYRFRTSGEVDSWSFTGSSGTYAIDPEPVMTVNSLPVLYAEAASGRGLIYCFRRDVAPGLVPNGLEELFTGLIPPVPPLHFYYPREYRNMAALRAFREVLMAPSPPT